mmetsp:Transcript_11377/g.32995  ORF Transcript_11377/g.32995 Transcript_11377/m.32995 type:complete len:355 (+) Transcript_11377:239-1303(+)
MQYLTRGHQLEEAEIDVMMGRTLKVPHQASGVAHVTFPALCATSVGAADFIALASTYHTVFLSDIPSLENMDESPNEIRRFINLIDILYERGCRVIFDAQLPPFRLFGTTRTTEEFEKLRQCLKKRWERLQDALDKLATRPSAGELNQEEFATAVVDVSGCEPRCAQHIFEVLDTNHDGKLHVEALRSALFFHAMNYDIHPPSETDAWFFDREKAANEATRLSEGRSERITTREMGLGYELYNEGGSSSKEDNKFAFVRTVSRMRDMISLPYLQKHQKEFHLDDLSQLGLKRPQHDQTPPPPSDATEAMSEPRHRERDHRPTRPPKERPVDTHERRPFPAEEGTYPQPAFAFSG